MITTLVLDTDLFRETVGSKNAISKTGTLRGFVNRYGVANKAVEFASDNTVINLHSFSDGTVNLSQGFAFSYWMYVEENLLPAPGPKPFTAADSPYQAFGVRSGQHRLLTTGQVRDRMTIGRYIPGAEKDYSKFWLQWFWDPVNFSHQIGWYQVIVSYTQHVTRVFIGQPNGQQVSAHFYMGVQNLKDATSWELGNYNGKAVRYLDDFKLFNRPLSTTEAEQLFINERPFATAARLANQDQFKTTNQRLKSTAELSYRVFPNPTSDLLTVQIKGPQVAQIQVLLSNMAGEVVMDNAVSLRGGTNSFNLSLRRKNALPSGMYILKLLSPGSSSVAGHVFIKKIILK